MIPGVDALVGPVTVAAAVLGLGGLAKVVRPIPTAGALRALRLPGPIVGVRALGAGEVALAAAAVVTGGIAAGWRLVAVAYVAFAGFVVAARRAGTDIQSCGCFGTIDTPPSLVHVVVNLGFAGLAASAAVVGRPLAPGACSAGQPAAGLPFLLLVGVTVYLVYLALAVLPLTYAAIGDAHGRGHRGAAVSRWLQERTTQLLGARTSRRGFLARTAVVGSALATNPRRVRAQADARRTPPPASAATSRACAVRPAATATPSSAAR